MTQTVDTSADSDRAAEIRNALTDKLRSDGMITSSVVERAFRTVPRHLFVPEGTPLESPTTPTTRWRPRGSRTA